MTWKRIVVLAIACGLVAAALLLLPSAQVSAPTGKVDIGTPAPQEVMLRPAMVFDTPTPGSTPTPTKDGSYWPKPTYAVDADPDDFGVKVRDAITVVMTAVAGGTPEDIAELFDMRPITTTPTTTPQARYAGRSIDITPLGNVAHDLTFVEVNAATTMLTQYIVTDTNDLAIQGVFARGESLSLNESVAFYMVLSGDTGSNVAQPTMWPTATPISTVYPPNLSIHAEMPVWQDYPTAVPMNAVVWKIQPRGGYNPIVTEWIWGSEYYDTVDTLAYSHGTFYYLGD